MAASVNYVTGLCFVFGFIAYSNCHERPGLTSNTWSEYKETARPSTKSWRDWKTTTSWIDYGEYTTTESTGSGLSVGFVVGMIFVILFIMFCSVLGVYLRIRRWHGRLTRWGVIGQGSSNGVIVQRTAVTVVNNSVPIPGAAPATQFCPPPAYTPTGGPLPGNDYNAGYDQPRAPPTFQPLPQQLQIDGAGV